MIHSVNTASRSHTIALVAKLSMGQIRGSLCLILSLQFCWDCISRWQVLLSCWASTIPYLEALLGNANKCVEVSESFSLRQQPADLSTIACSQLHICSMEADGTPSCRAAAVHGSAMFTGGNRHGKGI